MGETGLSFDLKDREQAKEYLDNVRMEYNFQCFGEEKPEGCQRLGDFLEAIDQDLVKARRVYKDNCDKRQFGASCTKFANYCHLGKGGDQQTKVAYEYFQKGCEYGFNSACLYAGLMTNSEKFSEKPDFTKGMKLLEKACTLGEFKGCQHLSGMYLTGEHVERDLKKAFQYANRGCDLGDRYACANLSIMYSRGEGVEQDKTQAQRFKQIALNIQESETKRERNVTGGER